jgi:hypothetical protein
MGLPPLVGFDEVEEHVRLLGTVVLGGDTTRNESEGRQFACGVREFAAFDQDDRWQR